MISSANARRRIVLALAAASAGLVGPALAQTPPSPTPGSPPAHGYPDRPIRLIVGYTPGGGADIMGRLIARQISDALGQPVVVENRPGAGQNIGAQLVAQSPADGYTLLMSSSALGVNLHIYRKIGYDPIRDFAPVAVFAQSPNLLIVRDAAPPRSVADLIARARAEPGKMNFSTSGSGSTQHLAAELLNSSAGIKVTHIPYRGTAPSLTAVASGEVDYTFTNIPSAKPLLEDGRARALAITSERRSPLFPSVPTMIEAGVEGFAVSAWYGVLAPAQTPAAIVARLNQAINQAVRQDGFRKQLEDLGVEPMAESPEYFAGFLKTEIDRWGKVVAQTSIKAD